MWFIGCHVGKLSTKFDVIDQSAALLLMICYTLFLVFRGCPQNDKGVLKREWTAIHQIWWGPCLIIDTHQVKQDAQLSQRDRAAGCVIVFAKSRRLELGDNILRTL